MSSRSPQCCSPMHWRSQACCSPLPSLDDGGPEARRDASHPAPLRSSPHIHVRSFERVALTRHPVSPFNLRNRQDYA
jgi:hypothetical protein